MFAHVTIHTKNGKVREIRTSNSRIGVSLVHEGGDVPEDFISKKLDKPYGFPVNMHQGEKSPREAIPLVTTVMRDPLFLSVLINSTTEEERLVIKRESAKEIHWLAVLLHQMRTPCMNSLMDRLDVQVRDHLVARLDELLFIHNELCVHLGLEQEKIITEGLQKLYPEPQSRGAAKSEKVEKCATCGKSIDHIEAHDLCKSCRRAQDDHSF